MKQILALQAKQQKIQKAFMKDIEPLQKKLVKIGKQIKKCKDCKEYEFKIVVCEKHLNQLKDVGEEMTKIKFYYTTKQELSR